MQRTDSKKEFTLAELTKSLDCVTLKGDPNCKIKGVCTIQDALPHHITFLTNSLYKKYLPTTKAAAVILGPNDVDICPVNALISTNPHLTYAKIAAHFDSKSHSPQGIHSSAVIGENCEIDSTASIGARCVIGNNVKIAAQVFLGPGSVIGDDVEIDEGSRLDANVTIYHAVKIGKRVLISSGAVIGSDGFSLARNKNTWHKVPQLGSVILEDDVEIGANTAIDRGAVEDTIIKQGAKLDNLIQVGHNVKIGENTAIAGHVAIAGSAEIGKNCLIAGCSGIGGHITMTDNVVLTGMTALSKSINEPGIYSSGIGGVVTNKEWRKTSARVHRLEQLTEKVKSLETIIKVLTERKES